MHRRRRSLGEDHRASVHVNSGAVIVGRTAHGQRARTNLRHYRTAGDVGGDDVTRATDREGTTRDGAEHRGRIAGARARGVDQRTDAVDALTGDVAEGLRNRLAIQVHRTTLRHRRTDGVITQRIRVRELQDALVDRRATGVRVITREHHRAGAARRVTDGDVVRVR